ncbi:hypothetical protein AB0F45_34490 [Streptomyces achromogenes]|uniref:hypothetical protein n=1 Tax=Streptomyces achromogenes TaxID=67255 RepID=UPI0033DC08D8
MAPRDDQFIYSKRIIKETEQKTGEDRTYTDEMWDSVDVSKPSLTMELGREMWEQPAWKGGGVWPPRKWSELKKLPQDPERLISAIISSGSSWLPSKLDHPSVLLGLISASRRRVAVTGNPAARPPQRTAANAKDR